MSPPNTNLNITKIIEGLSKKPDYLLIFGICTLGMGGGASAGVLGAIMDAKPWISILGFLMFALSLTAAVITVAIVNRSGAPSVQSQPGAGPVTTPAPNQSNDYTILREMVFAEIEQLRKIVESAWVKHNLEIEFRILGIIENEPSKAKVIMKGSYDLGNTSNSVVPFVFVSQIDVSKSFKTNPTGVLEIKKLQGMFVTVKELDYKSGDDARGLQRISKEQISLEPKSTYRIEWTTSQYVIDLPYFEFWATAHPVNNMRIIVDSQIQEINISGDCYRREEDLQFRVKRIQDRTILSAEGVFLPFQGIFLRIERKL